MPAPKRRHCVYARHGLFFAFFAKRVPCKDWLIQLKKSGWVNDGDLYFSFMVAPQEHRGFKASG